VQRGIQPNTVAHNRLIAALGGGGRWRYALEVFERMLLAAETGGGAGEGDGGVSIGVQPDVITYGTIIAALERSGQWRLALDVFDRMQARRPASASASALASPAADAWHTLPALEASRDQLWCLQRRMHQRRRGFARR
jgi:pentatricopeptide repeat protein